MIPLRILHVFASDAVVATRSGPPTLLPWLTGQGHAVAAIMVGGGSAPVPAQVIGRRVGWWSWWRTDRQEATAAAGSWGADLIHAHGSGALATACELARGIAAPVVADPGTLAAAACLRLLRDPAIAAVVVPSEMHRAAVCTDARILRERVVVLPPGVDALLPAPRTVDGALVVGARLHDRQSARILDLAMEALGHEGLAASAVVSCAPGVQPASSRIRVVPCGAELAACDVLVELGSADLPMNHVVDALASGRPVIAITAGLLPELVQDGRSGLLIPAGDAQALSGALRHLAAADRRSAQAAGALQAARRHDITIVGETLIGVYRAAIGGSAAAGATTWRRLSTERLRRRTSNRLRSLGP
ncbi:MAG TPA: hypothetical protein DCS97_00480 [Planctomycetes bacterium]|nr:hypothetical protein [Planctomycetota bacterium]